MGGVGGAARDDAAAIAANERRVLIVGVGTPHPGPGPGNTRAKVPAAAADRSYAACP